MQLSDRLHGPAVLRPGNEPTRQSNPGLPALGQSLYGPPQKHIWALLIDGIKPEAFSKMQRPFGMLDLIQVDPLAGRRDARTDGSRVFRLEER
jgi:hypothetical protein